MAESILYRVRDGKKIPWLSGTGLGREETFRQVRLYLQRNLDRCGLSLGTTVELVIGDYPEFYGTVEDLMLMILEEELNRG